MISTILLAVAKQKAQETWGTSDPMALLKRYAALGFSPCLVYDDRGHWAINFDSLHKDVDCPSEFRLFFEENSPWYETAEIAILMAAVALEGISDNCPPNDYFSWISKAAKEMGIIDAPVVKRGRGRPRKNPVV